MISEEENRRFNHKTLWALEEECFDIFILFSFYPCSNLTID